MPRGPRRALVRHDPARREPGQGAAGAQGGAPVAAITNVAIWGNHSATQFPDFANAKVDGKPATEVITDREWLQGDFLTTVQKRGRPSSRRAARRRRPRRRGCHRHRGLLAHQDGQGRLPLGGRGQLRPVRRSRRLQFGFPVVADGKGNWSVAEASSTTNSPRGGSPSPPTSSSASARRAGARAHLLSRLRLLASAEAAGRCRQGLRYNLL